MSRLWAGDASLSFRRYVASQLVGRPGTFTSLRGCLSLPIEDPAVYTFARLLTVCLRLNLIWKVSAKTTSSFLRGRLRENMMPRLKYFYRHFPEKF